MQVAHSINSTQEQHITEEKRFFNHNSKEILTEDMEMTIQNLSIELNEAREALRQKKQDLDIQFSSMESCNCPNKEFKQFMDKMSNVGREAYQSDIICNSPKMNEDLEEKKSVNPKFNLTALKQLLVIVNKINKTYDPIRI